LEVARAEAEREELDAIRLRRDLEAKASRWRPKTRRGIGGARAAEVAATQRVTELRQQEGFQADRVGLLQGDHIGRPARTLQLRLERGRDLGRSAER
jgi:hypothetical protein